MLQGTCSVALKVSKTATRNGLGCVKRLLGITGGLGNGGVKMSMLWGELVPVFQIRSQTGFYYLRSCPAEDAESWDSNVQPP